MLKTYVWGGGGLAADPSVPCPPKPSSAGFLPVHPPRPLWVHQHQVRGRASICYSGSWAFSPDDKNISNVVTTSNSKFRFFGMPPFPCSRISICNRISLYNRVSIYNGICIYKGNCLYKEISIYIGICLYGFFQVGRRVLRL